MTRPPKTCWPSTESRCAQLSDASSRRCCLTIAELSAAPLQAVWPVQYLRKPVVPLAADEPASDSTNSALQSSPLSKTSASALLSNPDTRNISVFRRDLNDLERRASIPPSSYTGDVFGPHVQTGIDKAHNSGQLGSGVKVSQASRRAFVGFADTSLLDWYFGRRRGLHEPLAWRLLRLGLPDLVRLRLCRRQLHWRKYSHRRFRSLYAPYA